MYYAHTPNARGQWHDLLQHLRTVSDLTAGFAEPFGAAELGRYLGLWHDLGKFSHGFQQYLKDCEAGNGPPRGPDHKAAGSQLARQHVTTLAMLVQGHHGGLKDPEAFKKWFAERSKDPTTQEALTLATREIPEINPSRQLAPPVFLKDPIATEFFMRMLFSALVDADYLDTEAHGNAWKSVQRGMGADMAELWERFERSRERLPADDGTVNEVRREVYEACLRAAEYAPGLFRLTVPTGGGKTLSGMGFALRHALKHGLRRIIVAVPYISITEQTAGVYRGVFEDDRDDRPIVLEHHSGVDAEEKDEEGEFRPERMWSRLAAENWDAPIIVTTTVQLFESLFANRTGKTRKLHRLAKSVIMLDEVQALPTHLLSPALDALRQLCDNYGSTVVLSTATQPAFEEIPEFTQVPAREIVPDAPRHFAALKRVTYEWRIERSLEWGEVAELMHEESQALAVVNTKRDALALLEAIDDPDVLHLSTSLCGAHRRRVIDEVKRRLDAEEPCRLVSTQVIEAGVDLDFPLVLRAMGPLDGIIQAAGRCNREGRLDNGRVVVFRPAEGRLPPGTYRTATQETRTALGLGLDPDDPETSRRYFRSLFQLVDPDEREIQHKRKRLEYPEVARQFRMIEEDTVGVIVTGYGTNEEQDGVRRELESLRHHPSRVRGVLRRLQPYIVAVRRQLADDYRRQGFIGEILPGLEVGEWHGKYDRTCGLLGEDRDAEGLVF